MEIFSAWNLVKRFNIGIFENAIDVKSILSNKFSLDISSDDIMSLPDRFLFKNNCAFSIVIEPLSFLLSRLRFV